MSKNFELFAEATVNTFPDTKYMGSKQRLLPFLSRHIRPLRFSTALDAFSGSGVVSYLLKGMGAQVYSNDLLSFCFHTAKATIENNATRLDVADLTLLNRKSKRAGTFIRDTYNGLYFNEADCTFLDNLWVNIQELRSPLKRSLALAAASRAAMKKRPRGLFTSVNGKGDDGRRDLRLSMEEQFSEAVVLLNKCVFSNGCENRAFNSDVFLLDVEPDLVYFDPPYISKYSDADYTRRYHFVEGYCSYWKGTKIDERTKTKKIKSYPTAFLKKADVLISFNRLFQKFKNSIIVLSYSSNGVPEKNEIVEIMKRYKKSVTVAEEPHKYHHGNQGHLVGKNNSNVTEYLFIGQ